MSYAWAGVQADVNCPSEEDVVGLGEFECLETSGQLVTVDRVEVLKEVRVHRTAVQNDGLLFGTAVGDVHVGHPQPVGRRAVGVQEDVHLQGSARLDVEIVTDDPSVLQHCNAQHRLHRSALYNCYVIFPKKIHSI